MEGPLWGLALRLLEHYAQVFPSTLETHEQHEQNDPHFLNYPLRR